MDAEQLYTETIKRVDGIKLTAIEEYKLKFACKKAIEDNPRLGIELLITETVAYLKYILEYPNIKL